MPRIQVYLPDDLYVKVKADGLLASELLQSAVRAELRRRDLDGAADNYLKELAAEVGAPTDVESARAEAIARAITDRSSSRRAS